MRRSPLSHLTLTPQPLTYGVVVALLVSLVFSAAAIAAAGDPDPTFSGDGKLRTDFGSGASSAQAAVRQRDGKIVAVGEADGNFLVARYNLDGSLDPSFSADGRVQTNFGASDGANDVVLQGNTIVVVGGTGDQEAHFGAFALARYNPNGSLETSFSGDGKQTTDFGVGCCDQANGVDIQANGRIVAVGTPGAGFALARYDFNGSLDPNFSGDGKQTTSLGGVANGVAIQRDGRIVAVGGGGGDFELARYNPNGLLDPSFSGDGRQTTDFGEFDLARGVALQSGKIVAVGGAGDDFGLARYNIDGSLDSSFSGTVGRRPTSCSGPATREAMWQSRRTAGSSRSASPVAAQPARTSGLPATTPTARWTRASPPTAGSEPASALSTSRMGWLSRATAGSSRSAPATGSSHLPAIWGVE